MQDLCCYFIYRYIDLKILFFYIYMHILIGYLIKRGKKETFHMEMKPSSDSIF